MRIAMIGLGFMGSTHLKAYAGIPAATLAAVASDVPQQLTGDLSGIQGNLGGPGLRFDFSNVKKYADWREAVRDPDVEAVDVCLPTHLHLPVATAALEAGKHVLVEKPMARDGEEAWQMVETARKAGRVLMVAQVLRFLPEYVALRETIASGRLGTVRGVLFRRRCGPPKWNRWVYDKSISGGGAFDLLIHDVDFALHLFGKPQAVSAIGREDMAGGVDWVTGVFHYPDVAVAITGIAGPDGGSEGKPVGYVCFDARRADGTSIARDPVIPGGRDDVRERSALVGMHLLRTLLAGGETPL
jgi:predicted dehydrogenase